MVLNVYDRSHQQIFRFSHVKTLSLADSVMEKGHTGTSSECSHYYMVRQYNILVVHV